MRLKGHACGVVIAGCLLAMAACGDSDDGGKASTTQQAAASGFPVTIQNCGRTLTFNKAPSRVVAGYEPVFEVLIGLGLTNKVVGQTNYTEGASLTAEQQAAHKKVPVVSKDIGLPQREKMLSLRPDFVYAHSSGEFKASSGYATVKQLDAVGAKTYVASGWCTDEGKATAKIENTYDDIENIGKIFGVSDRAEDAVAAMRKQADDAAAKVKDLPPVKVAVYNEGLGPLGVTAGGLMDDIIERAGGVNVFTGEADYFEASVEAVAKADPDVFVVVNYPPFDAKSPTSVEDKAKFLFKKLPSTSAAKDKRFARIDAIDEHPGWRNADAVVRLAKQLHPEAFK